MSNNTTETTGPPGWITQRSNWLAAAIPATATALTGGAIHNISVSDSAAAIQKLTRINAATGLTLNLDAPASGTVVPQASFVSDPEAGTHLDEHGNYIPTPGSVQNPGSKAQLSPDAPAPATPPIPVNPVPAQQQPVPVGAGNSNSQPNKPAGTTPTGDQPTLFEQLYINPAPQVESPKSLTEMLVPGYKEPNIADQLIQQMIDPQPDPAAEATPKSLTELLVPGYKEPPVTVTAQTTVPVTPAVPDAITHPQVAFRIGANGVDGYNYSRDQFLLDLATYLAGRPNPVFGPGITNTAADAYDQARSRLWAARYTPTEQWTDLQWAYFTPRNPQEELDRQAALSRLYQSGIPWRADGVEDYIKDPKLTFFTDPTQPGRWNAPQLKTPMQIQQEILRANRPDVSFKDFANNMLMDMTIGPAIVLWDAAHDRGDHSGWEIAGAALMLGINIMTIVPGAGTLAAATARAGLGKIAPEFMAELAAAGNSARAIELARVRQSQQLLDDIKAYGQHVAIPPSHVGIPPKTPPLDLGSGAVVKEGGALGTKGLELPRGPGPEVPPAIPQMKQAPVTTSEIKPTHVEFGDRMPMSPVLDREVTVQLESSAPIPAWKPGQVFDGTANLGDLPQFVDLRSPRPADFDYLQIGREVDEAAPSLMSAPRSSDPTFDRLIKKNEAIRNGPITRGEAGANRRNAKAFENSRTISNGEAAGTINGERFGSELGGVSGEVVNLRGTPGETLSQLPEDGKLIFNTEHVGHDRALDSEPKIFENLARDILKTASGESADVVAEAVANAIRRAPLNPRRYPLDSRAVIHDIADQLGVDISKIDIEVKLVIDFPWGRENLTSPELIYQQICDSCRPLMKAFQEAFDDGVKIKARNRDDVLLWPLEGREEP
ncbi:hypothetical protein [Nocardia sp. NPDC056100]|uniref:hypothetical protein n=1 Tax=Nocardia sp. NPDC056100 TaxID=3345712 RepID=UPI0035D5AF5C